MTEFEDFRARVQHGEPRHHVNSSLLFSLPYVFRQKPELYDEFRRELADSLGVPERAVAVVGSAQLGFSLNPRNLGRPIAPSSDIDVIVVSQPHFDQAWLELNELTKEIWLQAGFNKERIFECKEDLYWGYIRIDRLPRSVSLARDWLPAFSRLSSDDRFGNRVVTGRLYRTWRQVERSYASIIARLRVPNA